MIKWPTALKLGRVSNLPTVWSNLLAAICIVSATDFSNLTFMSVTLIGVGLSFMYLGGMFLNDAFDAGWDAKNQPQRPIPSGLISVNEVYFWGFSQLTLGLVIIVATMANRSEELHLIAGIKSVALLSTAILLYNWLHKFVSYSCWFMGACRFFVYFTAGLGVSTPVLFSANALELISAALTLLLYIAGLTYTARMEHVNKVNEWWPVLMLVAPIIHFLLFANFDPFALFYCALFSLWLLSRLTLLIPGSKRNVPKAIGGLVAGVALLDSMLIAAAGYYYLASLAAALFVVTFILQRHIPAS